jgi:hypothetical protein
MASLNYTYVYFNIRDFTSKETLSAFTLPQTTLTFVPDFTSSTVLTAADAVSNKLIRWDFGDGSFSNSLTARHYYKFPGEYKVRLTVFDRFGNAYDSSYRPTIQVNDFIRDQTLFKDFDRFIYDVPASKIIEPLELKRQNSWQSYNALSSTGYTIYLYASGALSQYQNQDNFYNDKWSHLRALSRFYIKQPVGTSYEYKLVDRITDKGTEIYARIVGEDFRICSKNDPGSFFVGTTGSYTFYYVDDTTKNYTSREPPIFIFATLDAAKFNDRYTQNNDSYKDINYMPYSFQNLKPAVMPIIKVRHNPAENISISTTGIVGEGVLSSTKFDIPVLSWQNTEIPFVIRLKDEENFTTKTYPPLSSSTVNTSLSSLTSFNVEFGMLRDIGTGFEPVTGIAFYQDFDKDAPQSIGAFYKGYFITPEPTYSCKLTACVTIQDPINYPKDAFIGWAAVPQYDVIVRLFREQIYSSCAGGVTLTISAAKNFVYDYNNRNIYAIQVAPSGAGVGNDFQAWFADATNDSLIKFTAQGTLLSSFSLSSYPVSNGSTISYVNLLNNVLSSSAPASITLDGESNLWMALADAVSAVKIDGRTGYILTNAYPDVTNITYFLSGDYNIPFLSGFAGENLVYPVSIDSDYDNSIWVSYTHPVCSFLTKYDTYGQMLTVIPFSPQLSLGEVCIDRNKNVWVTAMNLTLTGKSLSGRNDYLYKFNTRGDLTSGYPISGFRLIGNITTDMRQNLWVVHDRDTVTRVDGVNGTTSDYIAGSGNFTNYICSIGGIASDTNDFLWIINNFDSKLYFIDTLAPKVSSVNYLNSVDLILPGQSSTNDLSSFQERSFLAYGDWLGARWINKRMIPTTFTRTITGESNIFNVYPVSGQYGLAKINEDFNAEGFYKSLIFTESLEDKNIFFDNFLGTIVGGLSAQPYELGKTVYEKIANYVSNRTDIDKCNLDALLSFCKELSIQFEQYNYPFPPQLTRLVNILSIKHKNLWGELNKFALNFRQRGTQFNPDYGTNRGEELSTITSSITSGIPIVAYETFSNNYFLVNINKIPNTTLGTILPLSTYTYDWGWSLVAPRALTGDRISDFYKFYTYVEKYENSHYDSIINWNDPHTTINYYNSSFDSWKGTNGMMDSLISYELTKGLRLFLSAGDIVYNN